MKVQAWSDREAWRSKVPAGVSGCWSVQKFEVTEDAARWEALRSVASGSGRAVTAGRYTRLMCGKQLVMSDTPDEFRDHIELFAHARGKVLMHGLGLGCALSVLLGRPDVEEITVVEVSSDVLRLVAPTFEAQRLTFVYADARTWNPAPGRRFDAVWHDIWNDLCSDNLEEMKAFHRRFGRRSKWQGSWGRTWLEARR